jgi:hypothetical protein
LRAGADPRGGSGAGGALLIARKLVATALTIPAPAPGSLGGEGAGSSPGQRKTVQDADVLTLPGADQKQLIALRESAENLWFMELIDKQFLEIPWYGSRQMAWYMQRQGDKCGRQNAVAIMCAATVCAA